jgi:uncharacterized protein YdbL (DUF1318 family)
VFPVRGQGDEKSRYPCREFDVGILLIRVHQHQGTRQADRNKSEREYKAGSRRQTTEGRARPDHQQPGVVSQMTRKFAFIAAALALSAGFAGVAYAQNAEVTAALSSGTVAEQADGYLAVRGAVSAGVKAEVEAINIKRRAAYTSLAAQKGVTVKDVAAAVGCTTLKSHGAALPAYCAN